jgi:D-sedoheptulose 7-phosphate isomerase
MQFVEVFLSTCGEAIKRISLADIEQMVLALRKIRDGSGRLFVAGNGGGAGHASHAVCDFRKLCGIDAYAPYDNVSELTARVNDDGWDTSLSRSLAVSSLNEKDGLFLFSVGGGDQDRQISINMVDACNYAREVGAQVFAVIGGEGGFLRKHSHYSVLVPVVEQDLITPVTEGLQCVIWHLLVSHPSLQQKQSNGRENWAVDKGRN